MVKLAPDEARELLKEVNFKEGLVAAIVRDFKTKDVLMLAYMNGEAVLKTLETGLMYYWSRSRKKLWLKGEQSKHYQRVRGVWIDCDGDALIFDVEQTGGACHKGYRSCFYRKLKGGKFVRARKRVFKPEDVYG